MVQQDCPQPPPDVRVDAAQLLYLVGRDDAEELMPATQPVFTVAAGSRAYGLIRNVPLIRLRLTDASRFRKRSRFASEHVPSSGAALARPLPTDVM